MKKARKKGIDKKHKVLKIFVLFIISSEYIETIFLTFNIKIRVDAEKITVSKKVK